MNNLFRSIQRKGIALGILCCSVSLFAQEKIVTDTIQVFEEKIILNPVETTYPKFKVGGVFQGRYLNNFKNGVDIDGLHHSDGEGTSNSFDLKRMRVSLNATVMENLEVVALVNLADFKQDPKHKVLENAYAKYTFSRYLQVQIGQFRPLFGLEETYPADVLKSIDYSNSYYLYSSNGWTSFQVGAALTGSVDLGKVPMSYGLSVTNGNGRNKTDSDNGKHYSSRLLFSLDKEHELNVGVSGGVGEVQKETIYAVGLEVSAKLPINDRWCFDFQSEAKQGTNHNLYYSTAPEMRFGELNDYVMKSFYILPNIRYEIGKKHFEAVEFACRYEYLDENSKVNSNGRQTWVPMLSLEFLKNYAARIQVGMQIDNFKQSVKDSKAYNSNLAFIQFQCRF
ncbi:MULTISPECIES: porin [Myroides]|uniref:Porin n=1 Tax=Myroides albus TaxID=2562892 RepID=A0A6I3LKB5_9FLAO|nr:MULTISPECIES: porin [Myroides]MTG98753.1 porin [Myroides albus]MVX36618.1 porin [Myroides sp. LoEW2-1]UVD79929.1 OprO/OprP family phosphate-selective porin [Myroides albus]